MVREVEDTFYSSQMQWSGLRQNLQETPMFDGDNRGFLDKHFSQSTDRRIESNVVNPTAIPYIAIDGQKSIPRQWVYYWAIDAPERQ